MTQEMSWQTLFFLTVAAIAGARASWLLYRHQLSFFDAATQKDAVTTVLGEFTGAMIVILLCS